MSAGKISSSLSHLSGCQDFTQRCRQTGRFGVEEKTKYQIQKCLCSGFQKRNSGKRVKWCGEKNRKSSRGNCQFICYKNTHTYQHTTGKKKKTANRPSAHPLPASPTAPLNVKKLCSGECCGKGQSMVMPQLTLCFAAPSRRRWNQADRRLTSTDSRISTTATATSNIHHTPNTGACYKGTRPHWGFFNTWTICIRSWMTTPDWVSSPHRDWAH